MKTGRVLARLAALPGARRLVAAVVRARRGSYPLYPPYGEEFRTAAPLVERLSDAELRELNRLLDWNCFLLDGRGRRFGNIARPGKRTRPETIPDRRIAVMDARFGLRDRHVLEFGCFEGIHTAGLCRVAAQVTAVDSRMDHVAKTLLRCAFLGHSPVVMKCDVDDPADWPLLPRADLVHHLGVLYHLADPVSHLMQLHRWAATGVMLDTHYAERDQATQSYAVAGRTYACMRYGEGGAREAFSGMSRYSRWLPLDTIRELLDQNGFMDVVVHEQRSERNGPRALLLATRNTGWQPDNP